MDRFTKELFSEIKVLSVFEQNLNDEISGRSFGILNDVLMLEKRINSFMEQEDEEEYKQLLRNRLELLKKFTADVERLKEDTISIILTFEEWKIKFGQVKKELEYDDEVRILLRNYGEYESDLLDNFNSAIKNSIKDLQKKWEGLGELRYESIYEDFEGPVSTSIIKICSKFLNEVDYDVIIRGVTEILKGDENNIDLFYLFMWLRSEIIEHRGIRKFEDLKINFGWDSLKVKNYVLRLIELGLFEEMQDSEENGLSYGKKQQDVYLSEIDEIRDRVDKELDYGGFSDKSKAITNAITFVLNEINSLRLFTKKIQKEPDNVSKIKLVETRLKVIETVYSKISQLNFSLKSRILDFDSWIKRYANKIDSTITENELHKNYDKYFYEKIDTVKTDIRGLLCLLYVWRLKNNVVTSVEMIKAKLSQ